MKKLNASAGMEQSSTTEFSQLVKQTRKLNESGSKATDGRGTAHGGSNQQKLPSPYLYPGLNAQDRRQTSINKTISDMIECGLSIYPKGRLKGKYKETVAVRTIITSLILEAYGREITYKELADAWDESIEKKEAYRHCTFIAMNKRFLLFVSPKFRNSYIEFWDMYCSIRNKMLLEGFIDFELVNNIEAGKITFKKPHKRNER